MTRDNLTTVTSLYCVQILEMIRHKKSFHRALCHIPHRMEVKGRDSGSRALQQGRFLPTWGRVFSKFVLQIHRLICETVQSCICVKWAATHMLSLQFLYFCSALVFLHAVHCCICVSVPGGWYAVRCFKPEAEVWCAHQWAPLQRTADHDPAAGGLCNTALQWSHLTQLRRRLQVGRGLISC